MGLVYRIHPRADPPPARDIQHTHETQVAGYRHSRDFNVWLIHRAIVWRHYDVLAIVAYLFRDRLNHLGIVCWSVGIQEPPEHDPEKWEPVSEKDHAQTKS